MPLYETLRNYVLYRLIDFIFVCRRLHSVTLQGATILTAELSTSPSKIMNISNEIAAVEDGT
jgi:hypothetical protein